MNFFGGGKKEAPKPKTLLQMSKEELDEAQKAMKNDLKNSMREMDRQLLSRRLELTFSIQDDSEAGTKEARDCHQEERGQNHSENVCKECPPG